MHSMLTHFLHFVNDDAGCVAGKLNEQDQFNVLYNASFIK